jgi:hypothetical protein
MDLPSTPIHASKSFFSIRIPTLVKAVKIEVYTPEYKIYGQGPSIEQSRHLTERYSTLLLPRLQYVQASWGCIMKRSLGIMYVGGRSYVLMGLYISDPPLIRRTRASRLLQGTSVRDSFYNCVPFQRTRAR